MNAAESLKFFLPEIFLLAGAFAALLLDLWIKNKKAVGIFSILVLIGTALLTRAPETPRFLFYGFFMLDTATHFFRCVAIGIVIFTLLMSLGYQAMPRREEGEFYSLFLFMAFGLILMAAAKNLLAILLSVEFVSILSYLLVGFLKKDARAKEAAIKYLLFGSLATGIMLYGMSFLYGATGSLDLDTIRTEMSNGRFFVAALVSLVFFLAGLGFKISMAPFHMWAPDVYEAAPTPVTAFLTVGPKAMGFAVLARVLSTFFWLWWKWKLVIMILSILTMTIGNVVAISQTNIKRLLAYSSIAQAGYILMGIAVFNELGMTAVFLYLIAYALTNLGAFCVVLMVSNHFGNDDLESYAGLAKRSPLLAASLTLFLLSLAGIPPLAGFVAKFYVFSTVIAQHFIVLAIAAAINSAVAAFYYFKVVRMMYLMPAASEEPITHSAPLAFALALLVAGVVFIGLAPSPLISFVRSMLMI